MRGFAESVDAGVVRFHFRSSEEFGFKATVVAVDELQARGKALLWMSEAAMVAAPITTGSLVSISVVDAAPAAESHSWPFASLAEIGNTQTGLEIPHKEGPGTYAAIAMAWPSKKLVRNEVRLSRVLVTSLGSVPIGATVSLRQLTLRTSEGDATIGPSGDENTVGHARLAAVQECSRVTLRWCPPPQACQTKGIAVGRQSTSPFRSTDAVISSPSQQSLKNHMFSEIGSPFSQGKPVSASPIGRGSFSESLGSKGTPTHRDKYEQRNSVNQRNEISALQNWASVMAAFQEGKEKVKTLLEIFAARWIAGRYLLLGNVVQIPLCGCDCLFLVTDADRSQNTMLGTSNSQQQIISTSLSSLEQDENRPGEKASLASPSPLIVYLMAPNTRVDLLPSLQNEEPAAEVILQQAGPSGTALAQDPGLEGIVGKAKYSALGGLSTQIDILKQHVELSLLHPEYLSRYGQQPVRGVLLHGPPGTGKSSLARAAACEAGVGLFAVNGPEIVSEFYGESENALRKVFASAAKAAPSVVFIDELDAIAPARKDGSEELGQRMVAALLTLMDGGALEPLGRVLVIAASNRIDTIDSALRRPGRFDYEIEIGVPSPSDRHGILQVVLSDVQHTLLPSDIANLAATTHGFVGADLAALCNEAAMSALRRTVQKDNLPVANLAQKISSLRLTLNSTDSSGDPLQGASGQRQGGGCAPCSDAGHQPPLKVTLEDFQVAKTKVRPSAMREVALEVPKVRWSDIGGQDDVKQKLKEIVEWPQKQSEAIARLGIDPPHGVLLHGPPGCSKTLMARAVASETGLNFIAVKGPELFSKWVGESEKAVQTLFARARAAAPSVVFFDEIDGLAVKRESGQGNGVSVGDRVMSQLLTEMDGLVPMKGVSVIAATNRLDVIDDALLRPGRFDRVLYVGPPDEVARQQIFSIHLHQIPCGSDVCLSNLAARTVNFTGAEIAAVCQEAAMASLSEDLEAKDVKMCHFNQALKFWSSEVAMETNMAGA